MESCDPFSFVRFSFPVLSPLQASWRSNHCSAGKKKLRAATLIKEANERILDAAILEEKIEECIKETSGRFEHNHIVLEATFGKKASQEQDS